MMTGLRSLTERLMVMSAGGGTISDEWRATAHGFSTNCLPSWVRLRSWNTVYILSLYCSPKDQLFPFFNFEGSPKCP